MQQNIQSNFEKLRIYEPQLWRLGALAERYFAEDPNTSLLKLRQFAETLAQSLAAYEAQGAGWRYTAARWFCQNLLDPFQQGGHCTPQ